ncbi:hypothetical protein PXH67_06495 [Streptomyces sp. P8-A8]|uniref:hypothetical protein n=1 Tax=Streptomyces sp. P8-A8 TaxID=3029759 RepID=UPI0036DBD419
MTRRATTAVVSELLTDLSDAPGNGDQPQIRVHFAFHPDMKQDDRDRFVMDLSKVVLGNL